MVSSYAEGAHWLHEPATLFRATRCSTRPSRACRAPARPPATASSSCATPAKTTPRGCRRSTPRGPAFTSRATSFTTIAAGRQFAEALSAKAAAGVRVRVLYDWWGARGSAGRRFWRGLAASGVEVRCFNPPRLDSPFGWISRDHRKCIVVDGRVAFVSGMCVGDDWVGDPSRGIDPWRDTGIMIEGPAVADVDRAFASTWALAGPPIPAGRDGRRPVRRRLEGPSDRCG